VLTSAMSDPAFLAGADQRLQRVLPRAPVTRRVFGQQDEITIHAEIYNTDSKSTSPPAITTSVLAADGAVVFNADEPLNEWHPGATSSHTARVPLHELPSGSYVLRMQARSGAAAAVAAADVPFTITSK
jgi:hypothetical protein